MEQGSKCRDSIKAIGMWTPKLGELGLGKALKDRYGDLAKDLEDLGMYGLGRGKEGEDEAQGNVWVGDKIIQWGSHGGKGDC